MALEEKFDISVEETDAQNITTIQEAADLIEDLVQKKPAACSIVELEKVTIIIFFFFE